MEEKGNAGGRVRILHQVLHRKVYNVIMTKKPFVHSQSKEILEHDRGGIQGELSSGKNVQLISIKNVTKKKKGRIQKRNKERVQILDKIL